jgi:hypothetical protein
MGLRCAYQHAEDMILQSIVVTMKTGTFLLASKCADRPAEEPFVPAYETTATTATTDDTTKQCLDEDNFDYDVIVIYICILWKEEFKEGLR